MIVCAAKIEEVMVDHHVTRPPDGDVIVFVSQIVEMTVIDSDRMRSAFQLNHPVRIDDLRLPRSKSDSAQAVGFAGRRDRKSTRLNSSHVAISYAVFCLK